MPVNDTDLILLGRIRKVHGYEGAVMLNLEDRFIEELPEMEWVFIEIDEKPVPFLISSLTENASGNIILKLEGYDSPEAMTEFIGCPVFIEQVSEDKENELSPYLILEGYKIFGSDSKLLGVVTKVMSLPMQYMLVLEGEDGDELLIPLNEEWILEINREQESIYMDLPDGIIQINK
ncbi:MAG: ribosome maturation factor RimM [Bacteroidales bacterium]|nr:ribosome maturation factor RimM [Bacteroidales bacterium]